MPCGQVTDTSSSPKNCVRASCKTPVGEEFGTLFFKATDGTGQFYTPHFHAGNPNEPRLSSTLPRQRRRGADNLYNATDDLTPAAAVAAPSAVLQRASSAHSNSFEVASARLGEIAFM